MGKRCVWIFIFLLFILPLVSAEEFGFNFLRQLKTFLNLDDTPNSYSGFAGDCVAVDGSETGLEFINCSSGGGGGGSSNPFDQVLNTTSNVTFDQLDVTGNFSVDTNTLVVDRENNRVGIGTASPSSQLQLVTDDGEIKLGTGVFTGKSASTDTGIELSKSGQLKSGVFTEVNGELLSYAINVPQIGGRDTSKPGGIFRMDTRSGGEFVIFGYKTGGSSAEERFNVDLTATNTIGTINSDAGAAIFRVIGQSLATFGWRDEGATPGIQTFDMRVSDGVLFFNSLGDVFSPFINEGILSITHGGLVGIGTKNPSHELNVIGDVNFTGDVFIQDDLFVFDTIGIGTITPSHEFNVVGSANITSNLIVQGNLNVTGCIQFNNTGTPVILGVCV